MYNPLSRIAFRREMNGPSFLSTLKNNLAEHIHRLSIYCNGYPAVPEVPVDPAPPAAHQMSKFHKKFFEIKYLI